MKDGKLTQDEIMGALMLAVLQGQREHVESLLAAGVPPQEKMPPTEITPFDVALQMKDFHVLSLMIAHGADVNDAYDGGNILFNAVLMDVSDGAMARTLFLIGQGVDPQKTWNDGDATGLTIWAALDEAQAEATDPQKRHIVETIRTALKEHVTEMTGLVRKKISKRGNKGKYRL